MNPSYWVDDILWCVFRWCFQPIWKNMLIKLDHVVQGENSKNIWQKQNHLTRCIVGGSSLLWKKNILYTWNLKQPRFNGCFNWMIRNPYIKNGWKSPNCHPLKKMIGLGAPGISSSQKSGIIAPMNIGMKIPDKNGWNMLKSSHLVAIFVMFGTRTSQTGIRDPKAKQNLHGWRFGDFQPSFLVVIWFIIQLKHPFVNGCFWFQGEMIVFQSETMIWCLLPSSFFCSGRESSLLPIRPEE